jgi:maleate isomerase
MFAQRLTDLLDPPRQRGIGLITPFDFALDRELWRWVPEDVSLHITRLPIATRRITVTTAKALADPVAVEQAARDVLTPQPQMVAYTCAAGSFVNGATGDDALRTVMLGAGAPAACTTSGALIDELRLLGVSRLALVTPYSSAVTSRLVDFLAEHLIRTVTTTRLGSLAPLTAIASASTRNLRTRDRDDAEVVLICCTNIPTYDLLGPLSRAMGKPVLTANGALMHAALRALGKLAIDASAVG